MKDKSISKYLQSKSVEFLGYFPDNIKEMIINDAYITGGSLLNLKEYKGEEILSEKINDFDIYFKNKTTLLECVKHTINNYHIEKKRENYYVKCIEGIGIKFMDIFGNEYEETDYYADDSDKIHLTLSLPKAFHAISHHDYFRHCIKQRNGVTYLTKHSISIKKFQVIMRFVGMPDEVHKFFDFEHAKGIYDFKTGEVYFSDRTIRSIIDKELAYNGTKYPLKSILRTIKFIKRGWSINNIDMLKMIFQIQKMDIMNRHVLEDQLIGVYGENISGYFENITDSGIGGDLFEDLIFTLTKEVKGMNFPAYMGNLSIIDILKDY